MILENFILVITDRMTLFLVRLSCFRIIAMRSSINKAVKLAAKTSKSLVNVRALSSSSIKQWNQRYDAGSSFWGNGPFWGVQRFLEEVRLMPHLL